MASRLLVQAILVLILGGVRSDAAENSSRPPMVLLYAEQERELAPSLPPAWVEALSLEQAKQASRQADTVIVGGHSAPPLYLGHSATEVAHLITQFQPKLIVLETCYGASTPLLNALAQTGSQAWVVAAPFKLPVRNLTYGPDFYGSHDPLRQAQAIQTHPPYPLLCWQLDPAPLKEAHRRVDSMNPDQLRRHLRRHAPPLVQVPLGGAHARVLVPVSADRFR